jgi:ankyrin repeat protein
MSKSVFVSIYIIIPLLNCCIADKKINSYGDYLNWKFSNELKQGFYRKVELMIERGADLNNVIMNGKRIIPLIYSIQQQNFDTARLLINKGADINVSDQQGNTPLIWAVNMRDFELVELLLKKGANVKIVNKRKETLLDFATMVNSPYYIFEQLIEKGAPISSVTLENAIKKKCRYDVIKLLLIKSLETKTNIKIDDFLKLVILNNYKGIEEELKKASINSLQLIKDILYYCVSLGYAEQFDLFYKDEYKNLYKDYELTLAQVASEYGQLNMLKKIVGYGIDVNKINISESPLLISIKNNNKDIVDYLLSIGVTNFDINNDYDRVMYNNDILLYACKYADIEMIQLLRQHNIEFKNKDNGIIPGTILENKNWIQLINYLLDCGFDINKYNKSFGSLLIFATKRSIDKYIFEWIVDHSNIVEDRNPVSSLITYGENEKLEYLLNHGWERVENKFLFDAIWETNLPALKILLEHGINITEKYSDDCSPLYHASKNGYENIVAYLLSMGVNINEKNKDGDTALIIACKNFQLEVVDVLLKNNADIEIKNNEKKNALDIAHELGYTLLAKKLTKTK